MKDISEELCSHLIFEAISIRLKQKMGVQPPKSRGEGRRRRGGGDADQSLDETAPDGNVSESSVSESESSTHGDAPLSRPDEKELMAKMLVIQNKRFYIDVKENPSGRFVKLAEVLAGGKKARLSLTMRVTRELRNHLTHFSEFYASLGPMEVPEEEPAAQPESDVAAPPSPQSEDAAAANRAPPLKSAVIYVNQGKSSGKRRYYIDLKENRRGRFLQISEAAPKGDYTQRFRIAIPAQGLVEVRDVLSGILRQFGPESDESSGEALAGNVLDVKSNAQDKDLPGAKSMRVHPGKVIYFDPGTNPRGRFLKISQVTARFRTSILLPSDTLLQVGQILNEIQQGFEGPKAKKGGKGKGKGPSKDKRSSKPRSKPRKPAGQTDSPKAVVAAA